MHSEKAIKFCEISNVNLTVTTQDKSTVEILQKCVAFSEYMNFIRENLHIINISSTTYLPCLVKVVKERPLTYLLTCLARKTVWFWCGVYYILH